MHKKFFEIRYLKYLCSNTDCEHDLEYAKSILVRAWSPSHPDEAKHWMQDNLQIQD